MADTNRATLMFFFFMLAVLLAAPWVWLLPATAWIYFKKRAR